MDRDRPLWTRPRFLLRSRGLDDEPAPLQPDREWSLRRVIARTVAAYFRDPPEFLLLRLVTYLQKDLDATELRAPDRTRAG